MYKIGELSHCLGVTTKTLRYWSDIGLLVPDEIDRFTGYRYYSAEKLREATRIIALKELGFTLAEIAEFDREKQSAIARKRAELEREVSELSRRLNRLAEMSTLEDGETMQNIIFKTATKAKAAKRGLFESRSDAKSLLTGGNGILLFFETEYTERDFDVAAGVETDVSMLFASVMTSEAELEESLRALHMRVAEEYQITGPLEERFHGDGIVELRLPVEPLVSGFEPLAERPPFEDDARLHGCWRLVDIVPTEEFFVPGHPKCSRIDSHGAFTQVYFLEDGEPYWIFTGWDKGALYTYNPGGGVLRNDLKLTERDGVEYLLVYVKSRAGGRLVSPEPYVYVYTKVDSTPRRAQDISIYDDIDYPFIPDETVLGSWKVRDFYATTTEEIDLSRQNRPLESLWVRGIAFSPDGSVEYESKARSFTRRWTKGMILDDRSRTASAYALIYDGGREYLRVEWKSGDYTFGGRVNYYIFERA